MNGLLTIIVLLILILITLMCNISQLRDDLRRTQSTLDRIAKQVGVPDIITEDVKAELRSLVAEGKTVEAVKKYRILTGAGLKESKEYIDALSNNN